jgi:hypothetical protein
MVHFVGDYSYFTVNYVLTVFFSFIGYIVPNVNLERVGKEVTAA